uniref:Portal protein n=1 Tax=viral metagenome TaxID=1070528 RepID=A0A6M3IVQ4_9ZZZZ
MNNKEKDLLSKIQKNFEDCKNRLNIGRIEDNYKNYRAELPSDVTGEVDAELFSPEPFHMIEAQVPWLCLDYVENNKPLVSLGGQEITDVDNAEKVGVLINHQLERMDFGYKVPDIIRAGGIFDYVPIKWYWKVENKEQWHKEDIKFFGLTFGTRMVKSWGVAFKGPWVEVVHPINFFYPYGYKTIEEMPFVIHRFYSCIDELKAMAKDKEAGIKNLDDLRDGLAPINAEQKKMDNVDEIKDDENLDYKRIEILEWQTDGKIVWVANQNTVVKEIDNVYSKKTFEVYSPIPDPFNFGGLGELTPHDSIFKEINRIKNLFLDAARFEINPPGFLKDGSSIDFGEDGVKIKPGRFYVIEGVDNINEDISWMQRPTPNAAFYQIVQGLRQELLSDTFTPYLSGGVSPGMSKTTTGIARMQQAGSMPLQLKGHYLKRVVKNLIQNMLLMNAIFQSQDIYARISGTQEPLFIELDAVRNEYDITINIDPAQAEKTALRQSYMQTLQTIAPFAQAIGFDLRGFLIDLIELLGIQHPEKYISMQATTQDAMGMLGGIATPPTPKTFSGGGEQVRRGSERPFPTEAT